MNQDQVTSIVRTLFKTLGAAAIAKGYGDSTNWEMIAGAIATIIGMLWSHWQHAAEAPTTPPKTGALAGLFMVGVMSLMLGCHTPNLEVGGVYSPATTNAAGDVVLQTQPETGLYVADAAYKLAYDIIYNVMKFERDNRVELAKVSPKIKTALDAVRPTVVDIDRRWAIARKAYTANPTPAGLTTIQAIIAEIQRLVPVVQAELAPVYSSLTPKPQ